MVNKIVDQHVYNPVMGFKVGCFVSFFHPPEKTCQQKLDLITNLKTCYKKMGSKVDCYTGFCHHHIGTISVI